MHDAKGQPLKVGDLVMMPFTVKAIHASVEFCNVELESALTMPGNDSRTTLGAVNTQQVLRANPGDDTTFPEQESFREAVLADPTMTTEQKAHWLAESDKHEAEAGGGA